VAALALVARDDAVSDGGENPGAKTWKAATASPSGVAFDVRCCDPDLPASIPSQTLSPAEIPKQRPWIGTYRLVVAAPIVAFDIYWRGDEPLRIMTFSRGDWEDELLTLAR